MIVAGLQITIAAAGMVSEGPRRYSTVVVTMPVQERGLESGPACVCIFWRIWILAGRVGERGISTSVSLSSAIARTSGKMMAMTYATNPGATTFDIVYREIPKQTS